MDTDVCQISQNAVEKDLVVLTNQVLVLYTLVLSPVLSIGEQQQMINASLNLMKRMHEPLQMTQLNVKADDCLIKKCVIIDRGIRYVRECLLN